MTTSELFLTEDFKKELDALLEEGKMTLENRPPAPAGFRYKKTPMERLVKEGNFNSTYFIENIESLIYKTNTKVPSALRQTILNNCLFAARIVIEKQSKQLK